MVRRAYGASFLPGLSSESVSAPMVFSRVTSLLYMGKGLRAMEAADLQNAAHRAIAMTKRAVELQI